MLAGQVFHVANLLILLLAAAVAALYWQQKAARRFWVVLTILSIAILINEFAIAPHMAKLKAEAGNLATLSETHPLRQSFGMWHGISSLMHLAATVMAAVLVVMGSGNRGVKACSQ